MMIKSLALAAVLALALPLGVEAQFLVGFGGGYRSSTLDFDSEVDAFDESRTGFSISGFVGIPLSENFRIQPGIGYGQKGASDSEGDSEVTLELDYLEVPILGVVTLPTDGAVALHLYGGPYFGFEFGCALSGEEAGVTLDVDCEDADIETKSPDIGALFGAAVSLATSETMSIYLAGYYGLGLTNINEDDADDQAVKNRSLGLDVGLAFRVGG